jgi:hypothetical protein
MINGVSPWLGAASSTNSRTMQYPEQAWRFALESALMEQLADKAQTVGHDRAANDQPEHHDRALQDASTDLASQRPHVPSAAQVSVPAVIDATEDMRLTRATGMPAQANSVVLNMPTAPQRPTVPPKDLPRSIVNASSVTQDQDLPAALNHWQTPWLAVLRVPIPRMEIQPHDSPSGKEAAIDQHSTPCTSEPKPRPGPTHLFVESTEGGIVLWLRDSGATSIQLHATLAAFAALTRQTVATVKLNARTIDPLNPERESLPQALLDDTYFMTSTQRNDHGR